MSIQVLPPMPTLGQSLGQAFTRGLGETLPKALERGALSAGIKNLTGTPKDQFSQLAILPGGLEAAPTIMPLLESERAKSAARVGSEQEQAPQNFINIDENDPYFGQEKDPDYIAKIAAERSDITGRTFNEELKQTTAKFNKQLDRERQFITSKENLTNLLETKLNNITQNLGYEALPGAYMERLLSKGYEQLKNNPANGIKIAESLSKEAQDFMDNRFKLKNFSPTFFGIGDTNRRLSEIRVAYEKAGQLKEMESDLTNYLGLSAPYAYKLAYGNSAGVKSDLSSLRQAPFHTEKKSNAVFKRIAGKLTPRDSLLSIGITLRKKGYNPSSFLKYVSENYGDTLSDMQKRELSSPTRSFRPTLKSLFYVGE